MEKTDNAAKYTEDGFISYDDFDEFEALYVAVRYAKTDDPIWDLQEKRYPDGNFPEPRQMAKDLKKALYAMEREKFEKDRRLAVEAALEEEMR